MEKNNVKPAGSKNIWKASIEELSNLRVLVFCGMMCALGLVLNYVASIKIGPYISIGFSKFPNLVVDYLFGPSTGAIFAGVMDILKYFLKPDGTFFPGYTLQAMLAAAIYGLFFYRRPLSLKRIVLAHLIVKIFCNLLLGTLWLTILYGKAFFAILPARIVSNACMLPVDSILSYYVYKAMDKAVRPQLRAQNTEKG